LLEEKLYEILGDLELTDPGGIYMDSKIKAVAKLNALMSEARSENWYITTDFFANGGRRVMGPFATRGLALNVRMLLEHDDPRHRTYAVDQLKSKAEEG
jgi:hypothetical protein